MIALAAKAICTSTFVESSSPGVIVQKSSHTVFGDTSTLPTVLVAMAKDTIRGTLVDYFTQQCVYESMSIETPAALGTSTLLDLDRLQASSVAKSFTGGSKNNHFDDHLDWSLFPPQSYSDHLWKEGMKDGLR